MKAIYLHAAGALALSFTIAACVPKVAPPVTTPPVQRPTPTPTPAPVVQAPVYDSWMDAPQTPGNWRYVAEGSATRADYSASVGAAPLFTLQCNRGARTVQLVRHGEVRPGAPMTIRTETATRSLAARNMRGEAWFAAAELPASEPLLDAIALSKGRFAVEAEGASTLYLPSWAEISRVVEDCR